MRGEVLVAERLVGLADDDALLPCRADVRFQLASVSKQFTAAAVLLLSESGTLALNDSVPRWLEGCPGSWASISLHQLLSHTAGLPHWGDLPTLDLTEEIDAAAERALFQQQPLRSPPGSHWYYSSPGYVLLAQIVERAAAQPYSSFLAERIFQPLGMTSTFAGNADRREEVARGYAQGTPVRSFELAVVGMGAGDVWSTADDLLRWDLALQQGVFLQEDSRRAMFTRQAEPDSPPANDEVSLSASGYGYGWYLGQADGRPLVFHPGDNAGFQALNAIFPDDDLCLVVLSNEEACDLTRIARELLDQAFNQA